MTVTQMLFAIGQHAQLRMEDLQIEVTIRDVKQSYGRTRLLIEPVAGTGRQWVEMGRLTLVVLCARCGVSSVSAEDPICSDCVAERVNIARANRAGAVEAKP